MKKISAFVVFCGLCITAMSQCVMSNEDLVVSDNETLTANEISNLQFLREEEFLAGDVYEYLSELYSLPVFRNISKSEDVHTEHVRTLLELYNIEDPAASHETGKFVNKELQELYDSLVRKGKMSLDSAIIVGLTIEEKDIHDLNQAMENVVKTENIRTVYSWLLAGSEHHLNAFNFQAERLNLSYKPVFLSDSEFNSYLEN